MAVEIIDLVSSSPPPRCSAVAKRFPKRKLKSPAVYHTTSGEGKVSQEASGEFATGQETTSTKAEYVDLSDDILDAINRPYSRERSKISATKVGVAQKAKERAAVDAFDVDTYLLPDHGTRVIASRSRKIKDLLSKQGNTSSEDCSYGTNTRSNALDVAILTTRRSPTCSPKSGSGKAEREPSEGPNSEADRVISTAHTSDSWSLHGSGKRRRVPIEDDWGKAETEIRACGSGGDYQTDPIIQKYTSQYPHSPSDTELPDISYVALHMDEVRKQLFSQSLPSTLGAIGETATSKKKGARQKLRATDEAAHRKAQEAELKKQAKARDAHAKQVAAILAKVNLLRTDKKVSTPEMIVDLSTDLDLDLVLQIKHSLDQFQVEKHEFVPTNGLLGVIRWRRKVQAQYKIELGRWEPVNPHIEHEKHVMCIVRAEAFVERSQAQEGHDHDAYMLRLRAEFDDNKVIFVVQGLATWMKKNKTIRNRQFTDAVRDQAVSSRIETSESSAGARKKKARIQHEIVDEELIENSLLHLQVVHNALVHHTNNSTETARWVLTFTQHISTIPYKHERMAMDTAFCMETGQIKSGHDSEDTFVRMLQEISRITAPIAYGIAAEYPSVQRLQRAFAGVPRDGRDLLTTLRKSANKDGAFTDREIGKRVSHRLYSIFMGESEKCTDV